MTTSTQQSLPRPGDTVPEGWPPRFRALALASAVALAGFAVAVLVRACAPPDTATDPKRSALSGKGRRCP